jgi:hypothetical protein
MTDGVRVCVFAVHPSYQLVSSLTHQLTSHLVNITGAVTATIMRCRQNFHNLDNVNCEPTSGEQKVGGGATGKVR